MFHPSPPATTSFFPSWHPLLDVPSQGYTQIHTDGDGLDLGWVSALGGLKASLVISVLRYLRGYIHT